VQEQMSPHRGLRFTAKLHPDILVSNELEQVALPALDCSPLPLSSV